MINQIYTWLCDNYWVAIILTFVLVILGELIVDKLIGKD